MNEPIKCETSHSQPASLAVAETKLTTDGHLGREVFFGASTINSQAFFKEHMGKAKGKLGIYGNMIMG